MTNIYLTEPMQDYGQGKIKLGAYDNLSEVVPLGFAS